MTLCSATTILPFQRQLEFPEGGGRNGRRAQLRRSKPRLMGGERLRRRGCSVAPAAWFVAALDSEAGAAAKTAFALAATFSGSSVSIRRSRPANSMRYASVSNADARLVISPGKSKLRSGPAWAIRFAHEVDAADISRFERNAPRPLCRSIVYETLIPVSIILD